MPDATTMTDTTITAPAPVVSANIGEALPALFAEITSVLGVSTAALKAAMDQHAQDQQTINNDQQTINAQQSQIQQDQANLTADQKQIADDAAVKTDEDAALSDAEANEVSPATVTAIDNITNALRSGQPIPTGGIPTGPIPPITAAPGADGNVATPAVPVTVGSTAALPTDPSDPSSPTVDHTVTAISADGTISATPATTEASAT